MKFCISKGVCKKETYPKQFVRRRIRWPRRRGLFCRSDTNCRYNKNANVRVENPNRTPEMASRTGRIFSLKKRVIYSITYRCTDTAESIRAGGNAFLSRSLTTPRSYMNSSLNVAMPNVVSKCHSKRSFVEEHNDFRRDTLFRFVHRGNATKGHYQIPK